MPHGTRVAAKLEDIMIIIGQCQFSLRQITIKFIAVSIIVFAFGLSSSPAIHA
jgi:hypothetical protein